MASEAPRLYAERFGRVGDPAVVLIAGLAQQLTSWPMGFVHGIVVGGYSVVRFDNRDIGLSSRTSRVKVNLDDVVFGDARTAPYTIETMADDTVALLDEHEIDRAHIVGFSMGGMVAQSMAARYPNRVATITSLMSTTGASDVGSPNSEGRRILYKPLPSNREAAIEQSMRDFATWADPTPWEAATCAAWIRYEHYRGYDAAGVGRHIAAIRASGDRTTSLRRVLAPALIIHGTDDPLIDVSGGRATADALPHATYVELEGVAHGLPDTTWPMILRHIHRHLVRRQNTPDR